jgi:hypothetical protein
MAAQRRKPCSSWTPRIVAKFSRSIVSHATEVVHAGAIVASVRAVMADVDLPSLREEIPCALARCGNGIDRVANTVRALKTLAHPGAPDRNAADSWRPLREHGRRLPEPLVRGRAVVASDVLVSDALDVA